MSKIEFSQQETDELKSKLISYCQDKLDVELEGFDAQFLLDFVGEELGAYYYNQGLYDAQALMSGKMETLIESVLDIERDVKR